MEAKTIAHNKTTMMFCAFGVGIVMRRLWWDSDSVLKLKWVTGKCVCVCVCVRLIYRAW